MILPENGELLATAEAHARNQFRGVSGWLSGPRSLSFTRGLISTAIQFVRIGVQAAAMHHSRAGRVGFLLRGGDILDADVESFNSLVGINMRKFQDVEILLGSAKLSTCPFYFPTPLPEVPPPLFFGRGRFRKKQGGGILKKKEGTCLETRLQ